MQIQEGMETLQLIYTESNSIYQVFTGSWFLVYPIFFKMPTSNNTFKHTQPATLPKAVPAQQLQLQKNKTKQKKHHNNQKKNQPQKCKGSAGKEPRALGRSHPTQ